MTHLCHGGRFLKSVFGRLPQNILTTYRLPSSAQITAPKMGSLGKNDRHASIAAFLARLRVTMFPMSLRIINRISRENGERRYFCFGLKHDSKCRLCGCPIIGFFFLAVRPVRLWRICRIYATATGVVGQPLCPYFTLFYLSWPASIAECAWLFGNYARVVERSA